MPLCPGFPERISAVAFDLDGLMFNTEHVFARAADNMLSRRGLETPPDLLRRMMGRRPPEGMRIMRELCGIRDSVEDLQAEAFAEFFDLLDEHLEPMPGLFELLGLLESLEIPRAVATSSPRDYQLDLMSRVELLPRFAFALTAEDVQNGKPHPEIYLTAAARHGVSASELLVFEDSEAGTNAAAAAGAFVISVPHEHSRSHNFENASRIAESLMDTVVVDLLNRHQPAAQV